MKKTILLLEDDKNLNRGITMRLEKEGYHVLSAFGVSQAEALMEQNKVQLIISDITLEDGNGIDFCCRLRETSGVHLIFLTALDQEMDIVNGYDAGADDYMTKPFSLMVLVSKVHALMKRVEMAETVYLNSGDIRVSLQKMKAWRGEEQIPLSKKEMQLLIFFLENPKQILSREQITEAVWDVDGQFVDDNTVPVNISRLKGKLEDDAIQNVRGMGYIWTKEVIKE
ncbi:DNA-binding response regulator [Lactonifactor longoviformis]|uniref:Stage 0 sporulation protein A homolog n=1 Tax=Lactonifactor longoviformis DSM 17459 TaxID=1122155 RepID=A0A1M4WFG0_9CLOT|nr:response regulator transcription factor [Lactonifactor longoviformis]POP32666.1 DNA-binding response regulator [Lactonifactor longoviformis]SHE79910.1 DNA-binding response regulator, OmpR family, contains REC and winged-helix (wHTH) domain [Lactonifactor longoviformis DSM 17459]